MEPIKFISPSSFYYWEKCPLKAIYFSKFRGQQIFPKHPDADLGSLIHAFFENKTKWNILSPEAFEDRWEKEINKLDEACKLNAIQKIYFPIKWNAKYFAVKKILLKKSLFKKIQLPANAIHKNIKFEQWIDDGKDVGGKVDKMVLNEQNEIVEIIDFKTGNIFELVNKKRVVKTSYVEQLLLYAYMINIQQNFYPKCYIQDLKGNKHHVEINEVIAIDVYKKALALKNKINHGINEDQIDQLAAPNIENCYHCDYRPVCPQYQVKFINNFENTNVDIYGLVIDVKGNEKLELKIELHNKIVVLKNISAHESIKQGDIIFVYNLFCPDENSQILFAMKQTIIKHE
jgi:hypothetical protein